ncbi:MAG: hypothetical protein ACPKPY_05055 [Nitrososphaeraceae archaeon]
MNMELRYKKSTDKNSEAYQNFIMSLSSTYAKRTYHVLNKFIKFIKLDGQDKYKKLVEFDINTIATMIKDYVIDAKEKGRSQQSINIDCAAIKHFFEMNDIEIKWTKKLNKFKNMKIDTKNNNDDNDTDKKDRAYIMEEIRQAFNGSEDLRGRVIISILTSTGIRVGAFLYLRLRNLEPIGEHNIYKIIVYEGEGNDEYFTFCTHECRLEIDKYLDYRKRNGETLKPSSPLIREIFNKKKNIKTAKPRFLTDKSIMNMTKKAFEIDSGVREKGTNKKREVPLNHGFRKFYETTAFNNGMSVIYVRRLLGQKSGL